MVGSQQEKRLFIILCLLFQFFYLFVFIFFMNFRGLLKYQTNLDTHLLAALILMERTSRILIYQSISQIIFMNLFLEDFQSLMNLPNTFVKICMEEPRFQANFPQVRLVLCLYWSLQSPCSHKIDQHYI